MTRASGGSAGQPGGAGPSRLGRLGLGIVVAAIVWASVEGLCALALVALPDVGPSPSALEEARVALREAHGEAGLADPGVEVIHPYLGFVYDPSKNSERLAQVHAGLPISEFGFVDDASPFRSPSDDEVVVGIFGGSLAFYFSVHGVGTLADGLGDVPGFRGRDLSVVRIALGGYKQPQQLLALAYLLSMGAHFDVVINLDGFNEVALPPSDHVRKGVFVHYPRNWYMRTAKRFGREMRAEMLESVDARETRTDWAAAFSAAPLRFSMAANLLWWFGDRRLEHRISGAQARLAGLQASPERYEVSGPQRSHPTPRDLYEDLAGVWSNSSKGMHRLAESVGARYWHFLQPNQYAPGSKPMTPEESQVAFRPGFPGRRPVELGYPVLRERARELEAAGVRFHDLSMLFRDEREPRYVDACCHLNEDGYEALGEAMARRIREDLGDPGR